VSATSVTVSAQPRHSSLQRMQSCLIPPHCRSTRRSSKWCNGMKL